MNSKQKLIITALIIAYLTTRLYNLTILPIFNDEAIYLHWGLIMRNTGEKFFSVAFDGKQPLSMWLFSISMWFINDPLVAGRIISVFFWTDNTVGYLFLI